MGYFKQLLAKLLAIRILDGYYAKKLLKKVDRLLKIGYVLVNLVLIG